MFSYFAEKRHKTSISEKRPKVPAWPPSDSDSTWSHGIKSIKNQCGTFNAWLPQTSTRLYTNCVMFVVIKCSIVVFYIEFVRRKDCILVVSDIFPSINMLP